MRNRYMVCILAYVVLPFACEGPIDPDLAESEAAIRPIYGDELGPPRPGPCSEDTFPILFPDGRMRPPILECCELGGSQWLTTPRSNGTLLGHRLLGEPCSQADGVTPCDGTNCVFGPCGAVVERNMVAAAAHVFHPANPTQCGWSAEDIVSCSGFGGVVCATLPGGDGSPDDDVLLPWTRRHQPEPYTDQDLYPGLVAACQFNACSETGDPIIAGQ